MGPIFRFAKCITPFVDAKKEAILCMLLCATCLFVYEQGLLSLKVHGGELLASTKNTAF